MPLFETPDPAPLPIPETPGSLRVETERERRRAAIAGRQTLGEERLSDRLATPSYAGSKQLKQISRQFRRYAKDFLIPPYPFEELAALMETNATHYACVMAKATAISSVGWKLFPRVNEMGMNAEVLRLIHLPELDGSDDARMEGLLTTIGRLQYEREVLEDFFTYPNSQDTFEEINFRTDIDIQALGNGFWEVVRTESGAPCELYHVPAISVRLLANGYGYAQVRFTVSPVASLVTPSNVQGSVSLVFFKRFGDPWLMDWHTGRIQGLILPDADVDDFLFSHRTNAGEPLFTTVTYPTKELDPAPAGFTAVWLLVGGIPQVIDRTRLASEVIWWKKYNVRSADGYGIPDIVSAFAACAGDRGAHRYQLDFLDNNAVPHCVMTLTGFPPGDPEEGTDPLKLAQDYFDHNVKGRGGTTLLLEGPAPVRDAEGNVRSGGEVKIEKLSDKPSEAAYMEYLKHNRDEIMRAERTPSEMIASFDHGGRPPATGISVGLEVFKAYVIRPEQMSREQRLNRLIQDGFGFDWRFQFDTANSLDELREMQVAKGYADMHAITINEMRERMGKPTIPGGDRPFIITPMGMVFLDQIDRLSTTDVSQTPDKPLDPAGQGSPTGRGNTRLPLPSSAGGAAPTSGPESAPRVAAPVKNRAAPPDDSLPANNREDPLNPYGLDPRVQRFLCEHLWLASRE